IGRPEINRRVLPLAAYLIAYSPRIRTPQDKEFIRTHPGLLYKLWYATPLHAMPDTKHSDAAVDRSFISYFLFAGVSVTGSSLSSGPAEHGIDDENTTTPNYVPLTGEITAGLYLREPKTDFKNRLALTLDDIELNRNIDNILRILQKYDIQAVFFIETSRLVDSSGRPYPSSREFLQKILFYGHILGNHSFGHPNFAMLKPAAIKTNLKKAGSVIDEVLGFHYNISFIRPPYGNRGRDRIVDKIIKQSGRLLILWQIDSADWKMNLGYSDPRHLSAKQVIQRTVSRIKRSTGGVILLHGFQHINLVLEPIIKKALALKNSRGGFSFVPLEQLLDIKYHRE
ncbi:MAG: polysaccharide deacetylase family protein, partial [Spirochaetia bacterium]